MDGIPQVIHIVCKVRRMMFKYIHTVRAFVEHSSYAESGTAGARGHDVMPNTNIQ